MPEQPAGEQRQGLAAVALAPGVRAQADAEIERPGGQRAPGRDERLDAPDQRPVQVDGQIELAILQAARRAEPGPEGCLIG